MTNDTQALTPINQRSVDFYGDQIVAALVQVDGQAQSQIFVPIRTLCDYLGVNWSAQYRRIQRDPILAKMIRSVAVTATEAGERTMVCLPIEFMHGWLFGINATRVKPSLQAKLLRYQEECFTILWRAFQAETLSALGVKQPTNVLAHVREMGLAIAEMAEQQMVFETRLTTTEDRLDRAAQVVGDIGKRLSLVEDHLHPAGLVTDAQAAEISQSVKALAQELTAKSDTKRNQYQAVFGELYRRFGVSSYKNITVKQFPDVMAFLEDWRSSTTVS